MYKTLESTWKEDGKALKQKEEERIFQIETRRKRQTISGRTLQQQ